MNSYKQIVNELVNIGFTRYEIIEKIHIPKSTFEKIISISNLRNKLYANNIKYSEKVIGIMICKFNHKTDLKRKYIWKIKNGIRYLCMDCKCGFLRKDLKELAIYGL